MCSRRVPNMFRRAADCAALVALLGLGGCQAGQPASKSKEGGKPMTIEVTSTAFAEGKVIPKKYTGEGEDVSPPLAWSSLPEGTKQIALICDDPDAPRPQPWVHWVIYNMPADTTGLPEGVPRDARLKAPAGALQGENSWDSDNIGYRGPLPPKGSHRYYFKLYALDVQLSLAPGLDKDALLKKVEGHVLAQGQLMGTYERR
jgi:Raf kinase inhibitor-like YbhB/YbcL family protein